MLYHLLKISSLHSKTYQNPHITNKQKSGTKYATPQREMSNFALQIAGLIKEGLSPEEIADALGMGVDDVYKTIALNEEIVKEVNKIRKEERVNGIEDKFARLEELSLNAFEEILRYGENEAAKARVAAYILDQRLGLKKQQGTTNNFLIINTINNRLKQLREAIKVYDCQDVARIPSSVGENKEAVVEA